VIYNKEVQTMAFDEDISVTHSEEEIRQRVLRERDAAEAERAQRDKELEEESVQLDKEIEQEIRGRFLLGSN
jgi:dynein intermediate chain, cytosolic